MLQVCFNSIPTFIVADISHSGATSQLTSLSAHGLCNQGEKKLYIYKYYCEQIWRNQPQAVPWKYFQPLKHGNLSTQDISSLLQIREIPL